MVCNVTGSPGVNQATNNIADAAIRRHYCVVQAILHRAKLATKEMLFEAHKRRVSFAMVQEPYVGADGEFTQTGGYRVIQRVRNRVKPVKSAIIVLEDDLEVIEHPTLTTENIAVAEDALLGNMYHFHLLRGQLAHRTLPHTRATGEGQT